MITLQEALGDVVYAQLPEPEDAITAGEDCGALESVKAASEIYSPVSGTVLEKNEAVENAPSLINSSAMEEGWLFKVEIIIKKKREKIREIEGTGEKKLRVRVEQEKEFLT